jgi:hypothetical protein
MLWIVVGLIAMTLAATGLGAARLRASRRALAQCREWRIVTGRVIARSIRETSVPDVGPQYTPVVVYRYVVGDTQYESEHLTIGSHARYSLRRRAERRISRYAPGASVQVRVDPRNPAAAVLECHDPAVTVMWSMLVLIWIVMIGGIALLLMTPGVVGPEAIFRL